MAFVLKDFNIQWAWAGDQSEDGATFGAEWGINVINQPTSLADLDPAVAAEIIDLQGQVDNKIAIFVQESEPSADCGRIARTIARTIV